MNWPSLGMLLSVLLLASSMAAVAENRFTGTYTADARPYEMIYLALTQTDGSVTGVMTIVSPDRTGGVGNQTLSVHGNADGNSINLTAERFLSNLPLSGTKVGQSIDLTFPGQSGGLATRSFSPGSEREFNAAIGQWRQSLLAKHEEQEHLDADERRTNAELQSLAQALFDDVRTIRNTGIGDDLAQISNALKDERSALRELEKKLIRIEAKRVGSSNDLPSGISNRRTRLPANYGTYV